MQIGQAVTAEDFRAFRLLMDEMAAWDADATRALGLDPTALLEMCYSDDAAALQAQFTAPGAALYLARVEGVVAGCAGFSRVDSAQAELEKVFLRPGYRGLRLGRALLQRVMTELQAQGYRSIRLETAVFMTEAIASYTRFGFSACQPFRDPMPGLDDGTVFMSRAL